jgi:maltose O-acetyltransferase
MSLTKKISNQIRKLHRAIIFLDDPGHFNSRIKMLRKNGMIIGKNVSILHDTIIDQSRPFLIEIGDNVTISPRCHILTHDASMNVFQKRTRIGKVKIKDNCFIGAGTIILPNVTIGPNAIIGAGSVVTKAIPENSVYAGNPARFICSLENFLKKHEEQADRCPCYPYPQFHGYWITKENAEIMSAKLDNTFGYSIGPRSEL